MSIEERYFDSKASLLYAVESLIRETLTQSSSANYALMVSGGNTPLPVYAKIAADPMVATQEAYLAFTDDRYVPVDSPESNYGNAKAMIEAVGLSERTLRINPELPIEACASDYNDALGAFLESGGQIPIALLGLGADGHTCSLFNDEDLARSAGRLAAPAYKDSPPDRITVSPDLLAKVGQIIFVVVGEDKAEMIDALLNAPETITAGKAIAGCSSVALWRA